MTDFKIGDKVRNAVGTEGIITDIHKRIDELGSSIGVKFDHLEQAVYIEEKSFIDKWERI